ncbi:unnamed protein product [Prunus armeniaca]
MPESARGSDYRKVTVIVEEKFGSSELRQVVVPSEEHLPLAGRKTCLPWCSSCLPKGRCDVTASGPPKLRKGAFRREGVTSARGLLPSFGREPSEGKGRCDVTACREGSFQASEGSLSKGRCDVITRDPSKLWKGAFRREGVTSSCLPKGRYDVTVRDPSKLRKGAFRREGVTSSLVARGPSKLRKGAFRKEGVTSSRGILPSFGREPSEGKV